MKKNKYIASYVSFLEKQTHITRPIRILVDTGNGSTGPILEAVKIKNLSLTIINKKPDGSFPSRNPNPNELHSLPFKKNEYDFAVALDGDGDRAVFFDEQGKKLSPHEVASVLFLSSNPPFIADPVIRALFLYSGIETLDIYETPIGRPFIKAGMDEIDASVGAEYSGHYYFKSMFGIDSGILALLKFAESYSKFPYPLSTYTSLLGEHVIIEEMECENTYAKHLIKNARNIFKNMAEGIMEKDGIAFFFHASFLYIRPSHTEPVTRIYIIAREKQKANHLMHMIRDLFEE